MTDKQLNQEIQEVRAIIAEEAQDLVELTEELVDLEELARNEHHVPHARRYRIKVDQSYHEVHQPEISGEAILKLAGRIGDIVFEAFQHFRGGREERIGDHQIVNLRTPGVEKFTTVPKLVEITVDSNRVTIQAGYYIVSVLKEKVSVASDRVLDQVIHGEFKELPDQARVHIEGGEVFVSHVRRGQSS
jgi:Multiubiquitin